MNENTYELLEMMLTYSNRAVSYCNEISSLQEFLVDLKTQDAVMMLFLSIGELVNRLPDNYIEQHPRINWRGMVGLRNIAAHGYHRVIPETIWEIIQNSLPDLVSFLQEQLGK